MHIHQSNPRKQSGSVFDKASRLTFKVEREEERPYLAFIARMVRCGFLHEKYIEEAANEQAVLEGLTEDDISLARSIWNCICEGVNPAIDINEAYDLEEKGLLRDVTELPGRGRYAGRFEFYQTDRLEIVVRAASKRTSENMGFKSNVDRIVIT